MGDGAEQAARAGTGSARAEAGSGARDERGLGELGGETVTKTEFMRSHGLKGARAVAELLDAGLPHALNDKGHPRFGPDSDAWMAERASGGASGGSGAGEGEAAETGGDGDGGEAAEGAGESAEGSNEGEGVESGGESGNESGGESAGESGGGASVSPGSSRAEAIDELRFLARRDAAGGLDEAGRVRAGELLAAVARGRGYYSHLVESQRLRLASAWSAAAAREARGALEAAERAIAERRAALEKHVDSEEAAIAELESEAARLRVPASDDSGHEKLLEQTADPAARRLVRDLRAASASIAASVKAAERRVNEATSAVNAASAEMENLDDSTGAYDQARERYAEAAAAHAVAKGELAAEREREAAHRAELAAAEARLRAL